ncbi:LodA/GoxA family CTQ-dependent oxidase [Actinomadura vinacea]|uniref:LodA/GoxA family CTQ-dependent oxidase n=1 Tax=Actinomadura vinacea TaxID=115336 RepID=A0ABP5VCQ7_9ACTN
MADSAYQFRIHPAIGIARVGNSAEYHLGPETMTGMPAPPDGTVTGGLPIRAGTEDEPITSGDLRDSDGALKRQAARFRIYAYPEEQADAYPSGAGTEIRIGSEIGGRTVADIVWTVHLANKKANSYVLNDDLGIHLYEPEHQQRLFVRNAQDGTDLGSLERLNRLVIDPGPRAIQGKETGPVRFDRETTPCAGDGARIKPVPRYPKAFPCDRYDELYEPTGRIDTLGELLTDEHGRLLVLPAPGRACGRYMPDGKPYPLIGDLLSPGVYGDVNADGWFDDTGDGPVTAVLVFEDGGTQPVHGAWAITTDPGYAPQIRNVVTLWDDIYDTWVRELGLQPELFNGREFDLGYRPAFDDELAPLFRAAAQQRWTTNLPERAVDAHESVGSIDADSDPADTVMTGLAYIRDPANTEQSHVGPPYMPLAMGDAGLAFLTVTPTQYFLLQQWDQRLADPGGGPRLGPGEHLDKAVLTNCLGGRFAPGIEMTFIVREEDIYRTDWRESGCGPFRLRARDLDYGSARPDRPFLTVGYIPLHPAPGETAPLEPGDATKFMAVPWQTDYNSCATHNVAPNLPKSTTLFWSWPAQRPVQVHRAQDVRGEQLGPQYYSVRGEGTESEDLGEVGRYQKLLDSVIHWHRIGFVLQGSRIDGDGGAGHSADQYLEVAGQLDNGTSEEPKIDPWPMNSDHWDDFSGAKYSRPSP